MYKYLKSHLSLLIYFKLEKRKKKQPNPYKGWFLNNGDKVQFFYYINNLKTENIIEYEGLPTRQDL